MLSPKSFSCKTGLSYDHVLQMCKTKEIEAIRSKGGHFNIYDKELDKFKDDDGCVPKEEYLKVIRENERLKTILKQLKLSVTNLEI